MNAIIPVSSLTARFAGLVAESDPTTAPEAIAAARDGLLDFLACAFAGADDPGTETLWRAVAPDAGSGRATLIGRIVRTDAFTAALINGHAGHALDYDDVHPSVRGHPSTVILPALLAAAENSSASALELLSAYVVGVEAMCRLGLGLGVRHYEAGFHSTATLGTIGAAAALSSLWRFDADRTATAIGIAATQSFGLRLQFGTDSKPLHAGLAASAGLRAARLAAAGLTGASDILDGKQGFFSVYGFGAETPERAVTDWGAPWQITAPGLIFKEFACCTATHCAAQAALDLQAAERIDPSEVERIIVTFPPGGDAPLIVSRPETGIDGRFSVEYVVASALIDGQLGLSTFADNPVRPAVADLLERVERRQDAGAPRMSTDPSTRFSVVEVVLRDGRSLSRRVGSVRGASNLDAKFLDATGPRHTHLPALIRGMRSRTDLENLIASLGRFPEHHYDL